MSPLPAGWNGCAESPSADYVVASRTMSVTTLFWYLAGEMTTLIDYCEFEIESIPVKNVYLNPRVIRLFLTLYATETDTDPSRLVSPQDNTGCGIPVNLCRLHSVSRAHLVVTDKDAHVATTRDTHYGCFKTSSSSTTLVGCWRRAVKYESSRCFRFSIASAKNFQAFLTYVSKLDPRLQSQGHVFCWLTLR
ncbi:hypothetical protein NEUTE2DRAFT_151278 [Neurospora tetrasperma FGSC 2509]|nr:hypothetical protein NEUTE2DRAFT_151278 [Neurospora tetrasperma FGSC 2509]